MTLWDRRSVLTGLGAVGASLWAQLSADALGLADDKIKVIRYFSNAGDANGRRGQPMVNQSTNVVVIETEGRHFRHRRRRRADLDVDECASMLIGQDPFRIDQHWQRMMRGYDYPAGREKLHSLGALDLAGLGPQSKGARRPRVAAPRRQARASTSALLHGISTAAGRHDRGRGASVSRSGFPHVPASGHRRLRLCSGLRAGAEHAAVRQRHRVT